MNCLNFIFFSPKHFVFLAITNVGQTNGQTKQDLKTRILEHHRAIRNHQPKKSALCKHSMNHEHRIASQKAQILKTESDYSKRLFAKSWFIHKESNVLNRNDGVAFPSTYTKLLNY